MGSFVITVFLALDLERKESEGKIMFKLLYLLYSMPIFLRIWALVYADSKVYWIISNEIYFCLAKSSTNNVDAEFEELMNLRRQKYNHYDGGPQRLSCVEEKSGEISESLASLLADGFEIG